jgi:hypothetical protein
VVADVIDYVENPQKTNGGQFVTSYGCGTRTADDEFMLAKKEYEHITGRSQGRRDVLAYHIRQAFKPGEISPEEANDIGRQLVLSFTKGKHAFVVATHTDRGHIHNHIIFNSTTLDCERKFVDFKRSGKTIRRISDLLCAEHGLSVIENPKPSKGSNYADWLGCEKPLSWSEKIRRQIDEILPDCKTYDEFLAALRAAEYIVNTQRKYTSVLAPGQKKPTRLKSLGDDYTEEAIRARLGRTKIITGGGDSGTQTRVSMLIDIQAKLRAGKGEGYAQWAKVFNVKQAAKTQMFLQENSIDSYEDLKRKARAAADAFDGLNDKIKAADAKLKDIAELQKQIGAYGKTRAVYAAYQKSGWDRDFYDTNAADIILHRAAKKFFDAKGFKGKLPSINQLKQEYAALAAEKKKLYADYHRLKDVSRELSAAKVNAEFLLDIKQDGPNRDDSRAAPTRNPHER